MDEYKVTMKNKASGGKPYDVDVLVPDLVENVTQWMQEEFPEANIIMIMPLHPVFRHNSWSFDYD